MSLPSVLIKESTGEIIKHANYPREDMALIEGLDPDLEWLVKYEPFIAPDYDSRIFLLNRNESITTEPHPDYPHLNQYQITYETVKRSDTEIEIHIENAENTANESMLPYTKQLKILTLGLGILFRKSDGIALNTKETAIANNIMEIAVRMWKNDQALKDKIQELVDGTEPNIDEGWEKD